MYWRPSYVPPFHRFPRSKKAQPCAATSSRIRRASSCHASAFRSQKRNAQLSCPPICAQNSDASRSERGLSNTAAWYDSLYTTCTLRTPSTLSTTRAPSATPAAPWGGCTTPWRPGAAIARATPWRAQFSAQPVTRPGHFTSSAVARPTSVNPVLQQFLNCDDADGRRSRRPPGAHAARRGVLPPGILILREAEPSTRNSGTLKRPTCSRRPSISASHGATGAEQLGGSFRRQAAQRAVDDAAGAAGDDAAALPPRCRPARTPPHPRPGRQLRPPGRRRRRRRRRLAPSTSRRVGELRCSTVVEYEVRLYGHALYAATPCCTERPHERAEEAARLGVVANALRGARRRRRMLLAVDVGGELLRKIGRAALRLVLRVRHHRHRRRWRAAAAAGCARPPAGGPRGGGGSGRRRRWRARGGGSAAAPSAASSRRGSRRGRGGRARRRRRGGGRVPREQRAEHLEGVGARARVERVEGAAGSAASRSRLTRAAAGTWSRSALPPGSVAATRRIRRSCSRASRPGNNSARLTSRRGCSPPTTSTARPYSAPTSTSSARYHRVTTYDVTSRGASSAGPPITRASPKSVS